MLCNEPYAHSLPTPLLPPTQTNSLTRSFEWWQDGAPPHQPTLVSRLVTATYWRRQCPLIFPPSEAGPDGYGIINGARARDVNRHTGGWNALNTTRAMHTNGGLDPWRDATLSSQSRPGGPFKGSETLPVRVVQGGTHCSDLYGPNWEVNEGVRKLKDDVVAQMKGWVGEWYQAKGVKSPWEV